jgi:hypothetical protein
MALRRPAARRWLRRSACRIRGHRHCHDVRIFVHRAGSGIDPKPDEASKDYVACGHRLRVRGDYARSGQVALFGALYRQSIRAFGKRHGPRCGDHLRPALGLDGAGCSRCRDRLARSHWLLRAQMRSGRLGPAAPQVPEGRPRRGEWRQDPQASDRDCLRSNPTEAAQGAPYAVHFTLMFSAEVFPLFATSSYWTC